MFLHCCRPGILTCRCGLSSMLLLPRYYRNLILPVRINQSSSSSAKKRTSSRSIWAAAAQRRRQPLPLLLHPHLPPPPQFCHLHHNLRTSCIKWSARMPPLSLYSCNNNRHSRILIWCIWWAKRVDQRRSQPTAQQKTPTIAVIDTAPAYRRKFA